jgi:hypothetical protein
VDAERTAKQLSELIGTSVATAQGLHEYVSSGSKLLDFPCGVQNRIALGGYAAIVSGTCVQTYIITTTLCQTCFTISTHVTCYLQALCLLVLRSDTLLAVPVLIIVIVLMIRGVYYGVQPPVFYGVIRDKIRNNEGMNHRLWFNKYCFRLSTKMSGIKWESGPALGSTFLSLYD